MRTHPPVTAVTSNAGVVDLFSDFEDQIGVLGIDSLERCVRGIDDSLRPFHPIAVALSAVVFPEKPAAVG